jgi:hypothetical protein
MMLNSIVKLENRAGVPITAGAQRIRLTSQTLRIKIPGWSNGGLIWNRPVSVTAQNADGEEQTVPIADVTRIVLLAILGTVIVTAFILSLMGQRRA